MASVGGIDDLDDFVNSFSKREGNCDRKRNVNPFSNCDRKRNDDELADSNIQEFAEQPKNDMEYQQEQSENFHDGVEKLKSELKVQKEHSERQQCQLIDLSFQITELSLQVRNLVQELKGNNSSEVKPDVGHEGSTSGEVGGESDNRRRSDVEILAEVLTRHHSNKVAPEPESFTLNSGKSINRFFGKFEQYCISKFSTNTYEQWTSELGKFLKGDLLDVFKANGGSDLEYTNMKDILLQYANDSYETVENKKYELFLQAKPTPGEKLYIFALRLEKLFNTVYPELQAERNIELKTRFLQAIPSSAAKEIEKECCLVKIVNPGTEITWSSLKNLLRAKNESNEVLVSPKTVNPSIWYNSVNASLPIFNPNVPPPSQDAGRTPVGRMLSCGSSSPNPVPVQSKEFFSSNLSSYPNARTGSVRDENVQNDRQFALLTCSWCSRTGHHYDYCRKRLNLCLRCGNPNHRVVNCPLN